MGHGTDVHALRPAADRPHLATMDATRMCPRGAPRQREAVPICVEAKTADLVRGARSRVHTG
jgi:hypothetical protein